MDMMKARIRSHKKRKKKKQPIVRTVDVRFSSCQKKSTQQYLSGDLGQVVKLKAQRPLTDSEKLSVLVTCLERGINSIAELLLESSNGFNRAGSKSVMV